MFTSPETKVKYNFALTKLYSQDNMKEQVSVIF